MTKEINFDKNKPEIVKTNVLVENCREEVRKDKGGGLEQWSAIKTQLYDPHIEFFWAQVVKLKTLTTINTRLSGWLLIEVEQSSGGPRKRS